MSVSAEWSWLSFLVDRPRQYAVLLKLIFRPVREWQTELRWNMVGAREPFYSVGLQRSW